MTGPNSPGVAGDDRPEASGRPGMTNRAGRRRGRILLPVIFVGAMTLTLLILLLVGQIGR